MMSKRLEIIIALALIGLGVFLGWALQPECPKLPTARVDTLVIYDTIRDTIPVPEIKYITRTVTDTLKIKGDTVRVEVEIPIERVEYRKPAYHAVIEGYRPQLVLMETFNKTEYVTERVVVPLRQRWAMGPQVGYGWAVQNGKLIPVPFLGVGVTYRILGW